ncbi:MAG: hypothetical protein OHK0053_04660 [Microscillaceae bacterium]
MVFLVWGAGLPTPLIAQALSIAAPWQDAGLGFKISPLAALEPPHSHTFEAAIEYKFSAPWSLQGQVGYGNIKTNAWPIWGVNLDEKYKYYRTWRFRGEIRRYLKGFPDSKRYLALEGVYKSTLFFEEDFIGVDCDEGGCQYFRLTQYERLKNVWMGHIKFGWQNFSSPRFFCDSYVGLGIRRIHTRLSEGEDIGISPIFMDRINGLETGKYWMPSVTLGFRIGFWCKLGP